MHRGRDWSRDVAIVIGGLGCKPETQNRTLDMACNLVDLIHAERRLRNAREWEPTDYRCLDPNQEGPE